jgi:hypothetical protein
VAQRLIHTGQHYDPAMSKVSFEELGMPEPDLYLGAGSYPEMKGREERVDLSRLARPAITSTTRHWDAIRVVRSRFRRSRHFGAFACSQGIAPLFERCLGFDPAPSHHSNSLFSPRFTIVYDTQHAHALVFGYHIQIANQ